MPLAVVYSRARVGMRAPLVSVEVHISNGLPAFSIVGLPDTAVRESRERVRSAILNSELTFPQRRITINLAPADLPKDGGRYDLAIAVGILMASEQLPEAIASQCEFVSELALSGELRPVDVILTAALATAEANRQLVVAPVNAEEANIPRQAKVQAFANLAALINASQRPLTPMAKIPASASITANPQGAGEELWPDLADVKGQQQAKRALEIAAAGKHNLLMLGPPGAGKSMLATRLPGILPSMSASEILETAALHSVAGLSQANLRQRPFRAPHHTASSAALVGGGAHPKPGEISLAHNGVLFLDELPEFSRRSLEVLREPLESREVALSRATHRVVYPANFQLVAALNPCPCGHPEKPPERCTNPQACCNQYQTKLSGPLMDRIDLHLRIPALPIADLQQLTPGEPSAMVRQRVEKARQCQHQRQGCANQDLTVAALKTVTQLDAENLKFLQLAADRMELSARGYHRLLKVARTIADLGGEPELQRRHLAEALGFRALF